MKFLSSLLLASYFLHFWYAYQEEETVHFEVTVNFCDETYRDFFGHTFTTNIIRLIDENGKKYLMQSENTPSSLFYIDELPLGKYKIAFKNFKGKRTSIPIEITEDNQTHELCLDEKITWKEPSLFNSIIDGEILEIIFEGSGGVYYYEKLLIERQGDEYFMKDVKIKRDYSVPEDENKSHFENLVFKEVYGQKPKSISIYEDDWIWLNNLESVIDFIETKTTCMTNEEHYYFVKNGELLAQYKNGFCFKVSPWGKMVRRFFNR